MIFRDDLVANLVERQTQMQYAYEDRLAAARLRLDQVTSRQFIDQDTVEGKVQNLVIRQAMLETRAAVVAQLVEHTARDPVATVASARPGESVVKKGAAPAAAGATTLSAVPASGLGLAPPPKISAEEQIEQVGGKPHPEGMDLRLGHESEPGKNAQRPGQNEAYETGTPMPASSRKSSALTEAADPALPMPTRLASLAVSLDRVEKEQAAGLSNIVKPALDAAVKLRRAFDVAGLPVEKYLGKNKARAGATTTAVGGPFVPADPRGGSFERDLATAQTAVATLDGLRRALPSVPLRKPLNGELQMTSTFGYRTDPFLGRPALHSGVDLREEYGTPARATAAGVVLSAGPTGGYGNMVEIDHGGGLTTRYAHLSSIAVSPGQQVSPGATVGRVGSTGRSTGPHLHYEVRIDGEAVDPARFLRAATALNGMAQ
ncbi:peptidoglycan DD-metalloendopeptidase family protein [Methylocystis heyeri]|uniref:Peptidoglycan DD-metalloendopeptidase family protein n=2 Tax=Methylocystis heyeri TaxID=391905 RepID=A0A6B8KM80_9HYPH|nr:peptidoglycan DD-metalloendopeptidase family protein [Methylocystis heyeri]